VNLLDFLNILNIIKENRQNEPNQYIQVTNRLFSKKKENTVMEKTSSESE
jgi:hypothetical protein